MKKLISVLCIVLLIFTLYGCKRQNEYSATKLLMDTVCTIRAGGENARAAVDDAFLTIEKIAAKTDYFSEYSDVLKINRAKKGEVIPVGEHTANILSVALAIAEKSDGAFDITIAPVKDLWDFGSGDHEPPAQNDIKSALQYVGYNGIIFDRENKTVTKTDADIKIDLGGAAKGYAADRAAEVLKAQGVDYAVIDLGGNIYAFGANPDKKSGEWSVGIQKAFGKNGELSQTVEIDEGAVVTAGSYRRYFEWNNKKYHHILDPKTGYPTDSGIDSATVICSSGLIADCLSTACMVLGEEQGRALCDEFPARLIAE